MNIAVRELKDHLSEYLNRAANGEELVVTSHGKPIARLAPLIAGDREEAAIEQLRAQPWVIPAKKCGKLHGARNPVAWKPGEKMISEMIMEERQ